jgi:hypothetical protein
MGNLIKIDFSPGQLALIAIVLSVLVIVAAIDLKKLWGKIPLVIERRLRIISNSHRLLSR